MVIMLKKELAVKLITEFFEGFCERHPGQGRFQVEIFYFLTIFLKTSYFKFIIEKSILLNLYNV